MTPEQRKIALGSLLLSGAPATLSETLLASARVSRFSRGATIFLQGERASAIYIVTDGWVKLFRIAPTGVEAIVGVFTKGRSFGEAVALQHENYPVSAVAATDCTLIRLESATLLQVIRESPDIAVSILSATYAHLHSLVAQIEQLQAQTGAQRVAEFLLELAPCEDGECVVKLPYDKVLIAGRLGMKPESLSRAFLKLRNQGVVMDHYSARIADIAELRAYAAEDPAIAWNRGQ